MPRHFHFDVTKTTEKGNQWKHRYVVAAPYAEQELEVVQDMGYTVMSSPCTDHACLGFATVERPHEDDDTRL